MLGSMGEGSERRFIPIVGYLSLHAKLELLTRVLEYGQDMMHISGVVSGSSAPRHRSTVEGSGSNHATAPT